MCVKEPMTADGIVRLSKIEVYPQYLDEYMKYATEVGEISLRTEPGVPTADLIVFDEFVLRNALFFHCYPEFIKYDHADTSTPSAIIVVSCHKIDSCPYSDYNLSVSIN